MGAAAVGSQKFAHEQQALLDFIDKIQFAQLDNVKLPQIIVVGDQSAGKSSVLEAIACIPFPRDAGACTRFATEIRLRRAQEESFSVRIIPHKDRTHAERTRFAQFGGTVDPSMSFETCFRHAVDLIAPKGIPGRFATRDILVVEKSGPDMPLLTLVDLPGLVRNPNTDQSEDDIRAINDLTDRYMKSSRAIILAVVGGNTDYVQAPILRKAREFDPTGGRTIGVLTKPDLTDSVGLEDKFIALVNNKDKHNYFALGWYVLLNPKPREPGQEWPTAEERKQAEDAFFMTGKWSELPPTMCGVDALRQKLSVQLQRHIGKHVKTLRKEIQKAHDACAAELKSLGSGKDTVEEMRVELAELCRASERLVIPAVDGIYKNPPGKSFFQTGGAEKGIPVQNVRARAVEANKRFAERVRMRGHRSNFASGPDSEEFGNLTKAEYAREYVEPFLEKNRGTEFHDDHNPRLVYQLFQDHSQKWPKLAEEHMNELGEICSQFLGEVIDDIWPQRMHEPLRKEFLNPQVNAMLESAQKEVELLKRDQHFEVQQYDPEYKVHMDMWREAVSKEKMYTKAEELFEKMIIHYELSAKIFISNVITQVVERHLLQVLYEVFSPVEIYAMKNEKVEAIAAENRATREKRLALKAQKKAIEEAIAMCATLAMRKELRAYADDDPSDGEEGDSAEEQGLSPPRDVQSRRRRSVPPATAATGTPVSPQRQKSRETAAKVTPLTTNVMTNGSTSTSHNTGLDWGPQSPISGNYRPEVPKIPNGWSEQAPESYTSSGSAPQRVPPPPPRPAKVQYETGAQAYPLTPPDLVGRPSFSSSEQVVEASRLDTNGQRYTNPPPQPDLSAYQTYDSTSSRTHPAQYFNDTPQVPGNKSSRKFFSSSKH